MLGDIFGVWALFLVFWVFFISISIELEVRYPVWVWTTLQAITLFIIGATIVLLLFITPILRP